MKSRRYMSSIYNPKDGVYIPTVIVQFHNMPDLWMTKDQYDTEGKFKGLLKSLCVSIKDIVKVHHVLKYSKHYPTSEWEG